MRISFSPQRSEATLSLSRSGDTLTVNGEAFDFSGVSDGATLPMEAIACAFIAGDVTRQGGVLRVPLILPHGPKPPAHVAFPGDIVDPPGGPIAVPGQEEPR